MRKSRQALTAALGVAFMATAAVPAVAAEVVPFSAQPLEQAYALAYDDKDKGEGEGSCGEGKCGEGSCGEEKGGEGSCGEGKCGGNA